MHVYAFQILQVYFKDCRMYNDQSLQPIPVTTLKKEALHTHAQDSITTATTHKNSNISAYDSNVLVWPCILGQQKHLVCFSVRFWSSFMKLTDFSTGHNRLKLQVSLSLSVHQRGNNNIQQTEYSFKLNKLKVLKLTQNLFLNSSEPDFMRKNSHNDF